MKRTAAPPPGPSPVPLSDYVRTHCTICAAGWTRRDAQGRMVVICLLDRMPAWDPMIDCDRYELRLPSDPPQA